MNQAKLERNQRLDEHIDTCKQMLDEGSITQECYDFIVDWANRIRRMPLHSIDGKSVEPASKVTPTAPCAANSPE